MSISSETLDILLTHRNVLICLTPAYYIDGTLSSLLSCLHLAEGTLVFYLPLTEESNQDFSKRRMLPKPNASG